MENFKFKHGDRVKLIRDLPDRTTDIHPVHLYEGDMGTISIFNGVAGFQSDRWGDITNIGRTVNGRYELVINYCVLVNNPPND